MKKFVIKESNTGRLDQALTVLLKISRSQVQKLIDAGNVTVNGAEPKKAGDAVKTGDKIAVDNKVPQKVVTPRQSKMSSVPKNETVVLEPQIVTETDDYVVINKPAGLLVHPTQADEKNTLVSWLVKKYAKIKTVGDDPAVRPGIVHRLDKEASGLMVIARTQKMFEHLKEQFKNRTIQKEYLALVHGKTSKDWDEINFPIARGENNERMAARPKMEALGDNEKDAKTEFIVEKRFANCTLVRVTLHTGRMHQIRVHMLAYNHPLVGDPLYYQKKRKDNLDKKCGRLFLHSVQLAFTDLMGERRTFESALPNALHEFLLSIH